MPLHLLIQGPLETRPLNFILLIPMHLSTMSSQNFAFNSFEICYWIKRRSGTLKMRVVKVKMVFYEGWGGNETACHRVFDPYIWCTDTPGNPVVKRFEDLINNVFMYIRLHSALFDYIRLLNMCFESMSFKYSPCPYVKQTDRMETTCLI